MWQMLQLLGVLVFVWLVACCALAGYMDRLASQFPPLPINPPKSTDDTVRLASDLRVQDSAGEKLYEN